MRRAVLLLFSLALTVFLIEGTTLVTSEKAAQATSPGKNGKIVFISDRDNLYEYTDIYTMNPDGSDQTRLTNNRTWEFNPVWSPDGTKILFGRYEYSQHQYELYVMDADGSNQTRLTYTASESERHAEWSPDGTKIAFTGADSDIYVINTDGSNRTNLTQGMGVDRDPTWSPDGTKIAFTRDHKSEWENESLIYAMEADGSNQRRLTTYGITYNPDWSPDGTEIVYNRTYSGGGEYIFLMDAGGFTVDHYGVMIGATLPAGTSYIGPNWSPDGTKILFEATNPRSETTDLYALNRYYGTNHTRLTNLGDVSSNYYGTNSESDWQTITYKFDGFFSPIDNLPTLNSTRAGNAVPVKFGLNGDQGLDVFAEGYPKSRQVDCDSNAPIDTVEQTVTAGESSLSYDVATDRYTYMWKTAKAWAGTCRQFTLKLDDGTVHQANFKFK